jgi:hypothetical protein
MAETKRLRARAAGQLQSPASSLAAGMTPVSFSSGGESVLSVKDITFEGREIRFESDTIEMKNSSGSTAGTTVSTGAKKNALGGSSASGYTQVDGSAGAPVTRKSTGGFTPLNRTMGAGASAGTGPQASIDPAPEPESAAAAPASVSGSATAGTPEVPGATAAGQPSPDSGAGPVPAVGSTNPLDTNTTQDQKQGIPLSQATNSDSTLDVKPGSKLAGMQDPKTGRIKLPLGAYSMLPKGLQDKVDSSDNSLDPKLVHKSDIPENYKGKIGEYGGSFKLLDAQRGIGEPGSGPNDIDNDSDKKTTRRWLDRSSTGYSPWDGMRRSDNMTDERRGSDRSIDDLLDDSFRQDAIRSNMAPNRLSGSLGAGNLDRMKALSDPTDANMVEANRWHDMGLPVSSSTGTNDLPRNNAPSVASVNRSNDEMMPPSETTSKDLRDNASQGDTFSREQPYGVN